jgi:hypothetical protein
MLLKKLCALPELAAFNLVGGTSLALQTGHRISFDLDFFTNQSFAIDMLRKNLSDYFPEFELISTSRLGFACKIQGAKCDFFNWAVSFIKSPLTEDGIRLCSLEYIAAFKLDAIITRKEKKDFWDIEKLISIFGFENTLQFYKQKYPYNDYKLVLDALAEIDIADSSPEPVILISKNWAEVKQTIRMAWQTLRDEKLSRKEIEKQERLRKAEEHLKNKKKNS